jgi:putative ABC transport system permease protein
MLVVTASVGIGVPIGLLLGLLSVRVLGLFFTLPPPLLDVPIGKPLAFVAVLAGASAVALGFALGRGRRANAAALLREP